MLSGHAISVKEFIEPNEQLIADPVSEADEDETDVGKILYTACFDDLARSYILYDTIIWVLISLMLVLAWGVGILMLLYLPIRRYVLQKDISSRILYVTPNDIVYKVSRPMFLPFLGVKKIEKRIPLALVMDIIIEQGCLQSKYGLHTVRIESVSRGKAALVDELQVQGISNPGHLRKVIITEASNARLTGRDSKLTTYTGTRESSLVRRGSRTEGLQVIGPSSSSSKDVQGTLPGDVVLHKLDELNESVKTIESLIAKSQALSGSS